MANTPATPKHGFRCDDELWEAAKAKAHAEGTTLTDVLVKALRDFLRS